MLFLLDVVLPCHGELPSSIKHKFQIVESTIVKFMKRTELMDAVLFHLQLLLPFQLVMMNLLEI